MLESTRGWEEWSRRPAGRVKLDANQIYTPRVQDDSIEDNQFVNCDPIKLTSDSTL